MATSKDIHEAVRAVNDALLATHKLTRRIPKNEICRLVDQWMGQNKNDASEVAEIILFLENKSHRRCAYRYLEKISGFKGFDHDGEHAEPLTKKELFESVFYGFLALGVILGVFVAISYWIGHFFFFYIVLGYLGLGLLLAVGYAVFLFLTRRNDE